MFETRTAPSVDDTSVDAVDWEFALDQHMPRADAEE